MHVASRLRGGRRRMGGRRIRKGLVRFFVFILMDLVRGIVLIKSMADLKKSI